MGNKDYNAEVTEEYQLWVPRVARSSQRVPNEVVQHAQAPKNQNALGIFPRGEIKVHPIPLQ